MKYIVTLFLLFLFSNSALSWNQVGHELVAQIAYDQLKPSEQKIWNDRMQVLSNAYLGENLIKASVLPDELRGHDVNVFNTWHYIDFPIFQGTRHFHYFISSENILWALQQSIEIEKSVNANRFEKAFFGSFLIHLVADAHQPLHCASLYNAHFPKGDRGGNLYKINTKKWHNLHSYWDNGAGFLSKKLIKNKATLEKSSKALEAKYPRSYFGGRVSETNTKIWASESHNLAKNYSYALPEYTTPSKAYEAQTQRITQEQIVLAGYRLANVMQMLIGLETRDKATQNL